MTFKFRDLGVSWRTLLLLRYSLLVICLFQEGNQGPIWLSNLLRDTPLALGEAEAEQGP